jgi:hypothetical protein
VQGCPVSPAKKIEPPTPQGVGNHSQEPQPASGNNPISSNAGIASAIANYDPYGQLQSGTAGSFGLAGDAAPYKAQHDSLDSNGKDLSDIARA